MKRLMAAAAFAAIAGWSMSVAGEPADRHHGHEGEGTAASALSEPGQGMFAAMSEVVTMLETDPATDWDRVDIDALREHLLDMDLLVTSASVEVTPLPDGLRATVTGEGRVVDAVQRMIPAHAGELARDARWQVRAETTPTGAVLRVTASDPATVARIRALGFYGLLASQDHHRAHHYAIATGVPVH